MTTDDKISKILEHVSDMRIEMAKHSVYHENYNKKFTEHDDKFGFQEAEIKVLTAHKNTIIGRQTLLASLFGTICAAIGAWIVKNS